MCCSVIAGLYMLRDVHAVCLWDDKGPAKIHQALKEDILDFIKQTQVVSEPSLLGICEQSRGVSLYPEEQNW